MNKTRLAIICALFCLSAILIYLACHGKEDPALLALGDWKGEELKLQAEVTETHVAWSGYGERGKFSYRWIQTEKEPYRIEFKRGDKTIEADVEFDGKDKAILTPRLEGGVPSFIRQYNRSRGRAEDDLSLTFRRQTAKKG